MMPVIRTQGLKKIYGQDETRVEALRGVDLSIDRGQLVAIVGPSGCGKSSLLSLLGGVDLATEGKVWLNEVDLASLTDDQRTIERRKRIGFIFQSFNLLPTLTADENVALPLELDGVSHRDAMGRARKTLESLEMGSRLDHLPGELSGGEQQRVAISRALVIEPDLLLADEPTGNLDTENSQRIVQLLKRFSEQESQTIIIVTHDGEVAKNASRVIRLRDGRIVDDGPPGSDNAGEEPECAGADCQREGTSP